MIVENADGAGTRFDKAGLFFGLMIPVIVLLAIGVSAAADQTVFDGPYPTYWDDGDATGVTDPLVRFWVPFGIAALLMLLLTVPSIIARLDRVVRGLLLTIGLGAFALTATIAAEPMSRADGSAQQLELSWAAVAALIGVVVGAIGAVLLRDGRPRSAATAPPAADLPRQPVEEIEVRRAQAFWLPSLLVGLTVILMLVLGALDPWLGLIIAVLMVPTFVLLYPFRTRIGADGLRSSLGFLTVAEAEAWQITAAEPVEVKPADFGGIGYRLRRGGVGLITGRGPGIRVDLAGGRSITLDCPDEGTAARAAGILNASADAAQRN